MFKTRKTGPKLSLFFLILNSNKKEIANQSLVSDFLYSRWESNPNLRFRKPPFYPLNYRSIKKPAGLRFGTTGASRFVVFFTKN